MEALHVKVQVRDELEQNTELVGYGESVNQNPVRVVWRHLPRFAVLAWWMIPRSVLYTVRNCIQYVTVVEHFARCEVKVAAAPSGAMP
jgi:hypothetical protein